MSSGTPKASSAKRTPKKAADAAPSLRTSAAPSPEATERLHAWLTALHAREITGTALPDSALGEQVGEFTALIQALGSVEALLEHAQDELPALQEMVNRWMKAYNARMVSPDLQRGVIELVRVLSQPLSPEALKAAMEEIEISPYNDGSAIRWSTTPWLLARIVYPASFWGANPRDPERFPEWWLTHRQMVRVIAPAAPKINWIERQLSSLVRRQGSGEAPDLDWLATMGELAVGEMKLFSPVQWLRLTAQSWRVDDRRLLPPSMRRVGLTGGRAPNKEVALILTNLNHPLAITLGIKSERQRVIPGITPAQARQVAEDILSPDKDRRFLKSIETTPVDTKAGVGDLVRVWMEVERLAEELKDSPSMQFDDNREAVSKFTGDMPMVRERIEHALQAAQTGDQTGQAAQTIEVDPRQMIMQLLLPDIKDSTSLVIAQRSAQEWRDLVEAAPGLSGEAQEVLRSIMQLNIYNAKEAHIRFAGSLIALDRHFRHRVSPEVCQEVCEIQALHIELALSSSLELLTVLGRIDNEILGQARAAGDVSLGGLRQAARVIIAPMIEVQPA